MAFDYPTSDVDELLEPYLKSIGVRELSLTNGEKLEHKLHLGPQNITNLSKNGILCTKGTLITPDGIYNINRTKPSSRHPYGFIKRQITPNDFNVTKLFRF